MIHLLIDAGNSALKWQWVVPADSSPAPAPGRLDWHVLDVPGTLVLAWAKVAAQIAQGRVAATGCAVVSEERRALAASAWRQLGGSAASFTWLSAQDRFEHDSASLLSAYRKPEQLGADRWHAMLGARARRPDQALVVVCAGTATTVDSVDAHGRHLGGVIAPGVRLMHSSLARGTDQLTEAPGDYRPFPDGTSGAIRTGVLDAQVGLVIERARLTQVATGTAPVIVICGGHGPELGAALRERSSGSGPVVEEADLIFAGLRQRLAINAA